MRRPLAIILFAWLAGPVLADPTMEALLQKLEERDALIRDLQRRVETLERQVSEMSAKETTEKGPPGKAPRAAAKQTREAKPPAAGQFEVDEKTAERALERALVQAGVLLLEFGEAEIEPSFAYTRSQRELPILVLGTRMGEAFVGTETVRQNSFTTSLDLRIGLPWDTQLEFGVPYQYVEQSRVTTANERVESENQGSEFGDLAVGLAKTFLREDHWWPDLVGRVVWDTDTGKTRDNDVALGGGFHGLIGSLSALKRQDPLAFVGGAAFKTTFEKGGISPGDEFGFSLGVALAASPDTSLRFVLNQTFVDDLEVDNRAIPGSDQVIGGLTLGASSILGHRTLLDVSTRIGLTEGAPDYTVRMSIGKRFDVWNSNPFPLSGADSTRP